MKKGDKVIWRTSSGFCSMEFEGVVSTRRGSKVYVLFDGGGGRWLREDALIAACPAEGGSR